MSDVFNFAKKKNNKSIGYTVLFYLMVVFFILFVANIIYTNKNKNAIKWGEYVEKVEEDSNGEINIHIVNYDKLLPLIETKKGILKINIHGDNYALDIRGLPFMETYKNKYVLTCYVSGIFSYELKYSDKTQHGTILVKDDDEHKKYRLPTQEKVLMIGEGVCNGTKEGNIQLRKNEPTTLYVSNVDDIPLKLHIEGHDFLKIGGDIGFIHFPIIVKEKTGILLAPGERVIISFVPRKNNINLYSESLTIMKSYKSQKVVMDETGYLYLENVNDDIKEDDETEDYDSHNKNILVTFKCIDDGSDNSKFLIPTKLKKVKRIKYDSKTPIIHINDDYFNDKLPLRLNPGIYIFEIHNNNKKYKVFKLPLRGKFQHLETVFFYENKAIVNEKTINSGEFKYLVLKNLIIEDKDTIYIPPLNWGEMEVSIKLVVQIF